MENEISRKEAMVLIKSGQTIICQVRLGEFSELSTMEELIEIVNSEQRGLTDKLKFYKIND